MKLVTFRQRERGRETEGDGEAARATVIRRGIHIIIFTYNMHQFWEHFLKVNK